MAREERRASSPPSERAARDPGAHQEGARGELLSIEREIFLLRNEISKINSENASLRESINQTHDRNEMDLTKQIKQEELVRRARAERDGAVQGEAAARAELSRQEGLLETEMRRGGSLRKASQSHAAEVFIGEPHRLHIKCPPKQLPW